MNKDMHDDPENGIGWARGWLVFGVAASVAGNVANVCLTDTSVHVALRIPGAVFWPLALFGGIEVMVRNRHRRTPLAMLGRALLLSVAVTTFITSYVNLHAFMIKTHEPLLATFAGPVGIDGLMLGCTVMLLAATLRLPSVSAPVSAALTFQYARPIGPMPAPAPLLTSVSVAGDVSAVSGDLFERLERELSIPVSAPPAVSVSKRELVSGQQEALTMLKDGATVKEAGEATGVSRATVQRIKNAMIALTEDPHADVSKYKLNGELVSIMRKAARS